MSRKSSLIILAPILGLLIALPLMGASKGSVSLELDRDAYVDGKLVKPGVCELSWKSHSPDVDVTIWNHGNRIQVHATLVERDSAATNDSLVLRKDAAGRYVIREARLQGKKTVLVFE